MPTYAFNARETPDVASLQVTDDLNLRCYVWTVSEAAGGEQTIESEIRAVQDGEEVVVWRGQVRAPGTVGHVCDSPKVLGIIDDDGNGPRPMFVCHWLEGERSSAPALWFAYLDPTDDSFAWANADSTPTSDAWLYDVAPVEGGVGYVVVHREDANDFTTMRFETATEDWSGLEFAQGYTIDCEPGGVLCVFAHATDSSIAFAWERDATLPNRGEIWCRRMDLATGANGASWQAMLAIYPAAYTCGGWARRSANRWKLEVEIQPRLVEEGVLTAPFGSDISGVVWQTQNPSGAGAVAGGTGRTWHVRQLSRPWSRANGLTSGASSQVFSIVGHSEFVASDYGQSSAFVVELPDMGEDFGQRMLLSGNCNLRLVDARACGSHPSAAGDAPRSLNGRRTNHVSSAAAPSFSRPDGGYTAELKSRTVALCVYTRVVAVPNPFVGAQPDRVTMIVPQQTSIVGYSVHGEEPWVRHRDAIDPGENAANFKGVYAWHGYQPIPAADMLVIAGGLPQLYDGHRAVEIGWTWAPEIIDVTFTDVVTGLAAGVYQFTAIYEQVINGRVHRSAPAIPFEIDVDNTVDPTYAVTANVKCNTLSNRFDVNLALPPAQVVLYRADPGSTVFRRVYGRITSGTFEIQTTAHNLPDNASVNILDQVPDISTHDFLPWQFVDGNWAPLVPVMPPSASVGWVWRDRVVLVPSEEPNTFWYSLALKPGAGSSIIAAPEFSPVNVFRFDGEAIRVTAGLGMDSHSIVFADDSVFALDGRFNDDNGFGADLSLTLVHRGVGCLDQRSVVRTDVGVFFQSDRGIEFMDKGWALNNVTIGSSVEDDVRASGNLRSAEWIEEKRQVRWLGNAAATGEPIALVYHYAAKPPLWTRYTLPEGDQTSIGDGDSWMSQTADGCVWRDGGEQLHVVLQQGALLIERDAGDADLHVDQVRSGTAGASSNSNAFNGYDLQLSWLSLGGLARLQRVPKVDVMADPAAATDPGMLITMEFELASGAYPDLAPQNITRDAPHDGYIRAPLRVQKLSGLRIRLQRSGSFTTLPTWSVLGLALEVGFKKGRNVPDTQKAT